MELFWRLVDKVLPALYRLKGPSRPLPFVEDMAVPPKCLPDFLVRMQNVLKQHQVTASLFCHAGHGQLHIQPFLDLADPADVQRMRRLAEELYQEVLDVRDHQRRTCRRAEPHGVHPSAGRRAVRRVSSKSSGSSIPRTSSTPARSSATTRI